MDTSWAPYHGGTTGTSCELFLRLIKAQSSYNELVKQKENENLKIKDEEMLQIMPNGRLNISARVSMWGPGLPEAKRTKKIGSVLVINRKKKAEQV